VLADLCKVLGLARGAAQINERLDDGVRQTYPIVDSLGRTQQANIVSEAGMYEVIIRSDKPEAAAFRRWVTSEVLPSIRKHGGYLTDEKIEDILTDPDTIIQLATQLKAERSQRLALEERQRVLTPKAHAFDLWLSTNADYSVAQIAKALHKAGATRLTVDGRD
ncbi:phage antirepressor Ant, partial [Salmonella enterica subsp. enterica serovar Derby]